MKRLLFILVLALAAAQQTSAQLIASNRSYTANDTIPEFQIGSGNKVLVFYFKDSTNVSIELDYYRKGLAVFQTYKLEPDSTNSVNDTGYFKGYILRYGGTNNIPGGSWGKVRVIRKTTRNGTTTPTYDAWLEDF